MSWRSLGKGVNFPLLRQLCPCSGQGRAGQGLFSELLCDAHVKVKSVDDGKDSQFHALN